MTASRGIPRTLAIDPGRNPGLCYGDGNDIRVTHDPNVAAHWPCPEEVLIEDQHLANFIYKNGRRTAVSKKSQLTLVRTAERLLMAFPAERQYRILPDVWRRLLWPGSSRLTKPVVLARLRAAYNTLVENIPAKNQPDVLEARGMLEAWSTLSQSQKEKFRVR